MTKNTQPKKTDRLQVQDQKPIPVDGFTCTHCHSKDIYEMVRSYKNERALKCFGCGRSWRDQL